MEQWGDYDKQYWRKSGAIVEKLWSTGETTFVRDNN